MVTSDWSSSISSSSSSTVSSSFSPQRKLSWDLVELALYWFIYLYMKVSLAALSFPSLYLSFDWTKPKLENTLSIPAIVAIPEKTWSQSLSHISFFVVQLNSLIGQTDWPPPGDGVDAPEFLSIHVIWKRWRCRWMTKDQWHEISVSLFQELINLGLTSTPRSSCMLPSKIKTMSQAHSSHNT